MKRVSFTLAAIATIFVAFGSVAEAKAKKSFGQCAAEVNAFIPQVERIKGPAPQRFRDFAMDVCQNNGEAGWRQFKRQQLNERTG